MFDVGVDLAWLAHGLSEPLTPEERVDIRVALIPVAKELQCMKGALLREESGGSKVFSMSVVCLGRALDDFINNPAWNGLPFPEGDDGEGLREEVGGAFLTAELVLSRWYDGNVCGVHPIFLRRGGFMPVDSLTDFRV